jgi:hypothetical protein
MDDGESFEVGRRTGESNDVRSEVTSASPSVSFSAVKLTGSHSFSGASGVLVGFAGRAGSVIDAMEPLFLKKITNYSDKYTLRKS